MTAPLETKLTLGPVLFHWPADRLQDFYARIADEAPVDIVYLGEIVCSKRAPFVEPVLPDIIERLQRGKKTVVLSGRALVMTDRESRMVTDQIAAARAMALQVEVNDVGALRDLASEPHVIGPFINVYNESTLAWLARQGATRICLPPELPGEAVTALAATSPVPLEAFAFGRLPLAISARCFHARAHGLHKDSCRYTCGNDPDGRTVNTLDGEAFLAINGTQTMSQTCLDLSGAMADLRARGISYFRLSPQTMDMAAVAGLYRRLIDGQIGPDEVQHGLARMANGLTFSNGFIHGREGRAMIAARLGDPR